MKTSCLLLPILLATAILPALPADTKSANPAKDKLVSLAENVVQQGARVREGDLVHISGTPGDLRLLEELAVQARKLGAHPLITLTSDRFRRRFFNEVPAKYDKQAPTFELALAGLANVFIATEANDEGALRNVPAERMIAMQKASEGVFKKLMARSVRSVWLGNGLYPTASRAKRFGLTEAQLRKLYEEGLAVDASKMQAVGAKLQKAVAAGKALHLRSPAGTDLMMKIERRPVLVSDGILTPEKEKKGGAACSTWLPAGEVYVTPVAATAQGKVVAPLVFWEGQEIRKLVLVFKAGKLVSMSADSGLDRLQTVYKGHGAGKEEFGAIDIGINPGVKLAADSKALNYVAAGMVTVAVGNNNWAGGNNSIAFGLTCHLPGCTLKVDDTVLVDGGSLKP